jgi:hypothetical protein
LKCTITNDGDVTVDLADEPKEVSDYVLDQIGDRVDTEEDLQNVGEVAVDYDKQTLSYSDPVIQLVQRIIDEKYADMEQEEQHN